jgi:hypothetical protein
MPIEAFSISLDPHGLVRQSYTLGAPLPGYTAQPPLTTESLNDMLASLEAYRAEHGPVLRELRCQAAVREHLADTLSRGEPLPSCPPVTLFGIPLIDDDAVPAGVLRFVYDDGSSAEHRVLAPQSLTDWANSLLPPEIAAAGLHWEWVEAGGSVPEFLPAEQRATLAAANRHADERIAEWRERMAQSPSGFDGFLASLDSELYPAPLTPAEARHGRTEPLYWGEALTPADSNTPHAGSMTCAHICGPDADHVCDARAVTFLEHENLAGGVTRMPICGPCHASEAASKETADA